MPFSTSKAQGRMVPPRAGLIRAMHSTALFKKCWQVFICSPSSCREMTSSVNRYVTELFNSVINLVLRGELKIWAPAEGADGGVNCFLRWWLLRLVGIF